MSHVELSEPQTKIPPHAGAPAASVLTGAALLSISTILVRASGVEPITVAFCRCALALLVLVPLAAIERRRQGATTRLALTWAALAGVALGADYVAWAESIERVGAGVSTVLINVQVVVLPALAWAVTRERPPRTYALAAPLVLGGLALVSDVVGTSELRGGHTLGAALGLCAGVGYGVYLFLSRHAEGQGHTPVQLLTMATFTAGATAACAAPFAGGLALSHVTPRGWGLLATLALFGQVLAWLLIHAGSSRLPGATTGVLLLMQPPLALLLSRITLGERVSPVQLLGTAVIMAGVGISLSTPRRSRVSG